jgi:pimeloyl-ACP methyl ester carboxylesterase
MAPNEEATPTSPAHRIHVHRYGEGQQAYLGVHGWSGCHDTFAPLAPLVPTGRSLIALDLPGFGSSAPLQRWDPNTLAEILCDTLDNVDFEGTCIGSCSGALFGMLAALRRPDRFKRIVAVDPFAYFPWYFRLLAAPIVGPVFYKSAFANPIGRRLTNAGLREQRTAGGDMTESFKNRDHGVVYAYLRMLRSIPNYKTYAPLKMPIDVVYGKHTFDAVRRSIDMWKNLWPHANFHEVSAGHLPIEEATSDVADILFGLGVSPGV